MSLFCLCVVENISKKSEKIFYMEQIELLAKHYRRGVKFLIDWSEPIALCIKNDSFVVNILDSPKSNNCEMLLLPDGWYSNGQKNELTFSERIEFLQEISNLFMDRGYGVDLYLGESGTDPADFLSVALKENCFLEYLISTIGVDGVNDGVHISIKKEY